MSFVKIHSFFHIQQRKCLLLIVRYCNIKCVMHRNTFQTFTFVWDISTISEKYIKTIAVVTINHLETTRIIPQNDCFTK